MVACLGSVSYLWRGQASPRKPLPKTKRKLNPKKLNPNILTRKSVIFLQEFATTQCRYHAGQHTPSLKLCSDLARMSNTHHAGTHTHYVSRSVLARSGGGQACPRKQSEKTGEEEEAKTEASHESIGTDAPTTPTCRGPGAHQEARTPTSRDELELRF